MTVLKINRDDFTEALSVGIDFLLGEGWFLDTETGEVLLHAEGADDFPEDFPDDPRYVHIDGLSSDEAFQIMLDFVEQLDNNEVALDLSAILKQTKPFRRFKDFLYQYPVIQDAWYAFELQRYTQLADEWCVEHEIQAEWI